MTSVYIIRLKMEAVTILRLGRVFRAWRLRAFGIWLIWHPNYWPRQPAIKPAIQRPEDGAEVLPEELWRF